MKTESLIRIVTSLAALSVAAYACTTEPAANPEAGLPPGSGGTRPGPVAGTGGMPTSGGTENGGTGGQGTAGTGQGTAGTFVIGVDAMPDVKEELTEDSSCGTGKAEATLLPVNIMMMFDRSGSMVNQDEPPTRWDTATGALRTFFQAPEADGLGVALRFFPHDLPAAGCTANMCACDPVACSQVLVEMGTLTADAAPTDTQEAALLKAIDDSPPVPPNNDDITPCTGQQFGNTPIFPALDGALRWATDYQTAHPEQKTVVVFVTDGEPAGGCTDDFDEIDQLAADALAAAGINTYVIGLADERGNGVNPGDMNGLAMAGGTEEAFFVNDGPTASEDLLETFNAIRGMELSCDFPLPEATDEGDQVDPELVNVTFSTGVGDPVTFTKVTDAAACDTAQSWYYDDETNPTRIYLCPAACEAVTNVPMASVQVLVGCKPVIEPPH